MGGAVRFGPLYWSPALYHLALWGLYLGRPRARFGAVRREVEPGDEVVDLCAGTWLLYEALEGVAGRYLAFDLNPRLVAALRRRGIEAYCADVRELEIPRADVVTMSSALYHFHPCCQELIERMRARARKKVVLVEPVRNQANSAVPLWGAFARWAGRAGAPSDFHFTRGTLEELISQLPGPRRAEPICRGRDLLIVLECR
jgi:hypothetical protein